MAVPFTETLNCERWPGLSKYHGSILGNLGLRQAYGQVK